MKQISKIFILLVVLLLIVGGIYYILGADNVKTKELSKKINYVNTEYNFSLELPEGWTSEEELSFIDGVMAYTGRVISFSSLDKDIGFSVLIENNINEYSHAEEYVTAVLDEHKRKYENGEYPYLLEYSSKEYIDFNNLSGAVLKDIHNPGGEEDHIFIVGDNYIYKINYSYVDSDGISRVNNELRSQINSILDTFKLTGPSDINGRIFFSNNLGYSLRVPKGWFRNSLSDIYQEFNNSSDEDYFKSEIVGAPLEMTEDGIWITVKKHDNNGLTFEAFIDQKSVDMIVSNRIDFTVNGKQVVRQREYPRYSTEAGYDIHYYLNTAEAFYTFAVLTHSEEAFSQTESIIDSLLNSFKLI